MKLSSLIRLSLAALPVAILCAVFFATAAANTVAPSNLGEISRSADADDLKPAACAAQDVRRIITGGEVITGTSGSDLILGGEGDDTIWGEGGDDCIVGGGGDDTLIGGEGDDRCIGGPGSDQIDLSCED